MQACHEFVGANSSGINVQPLVQDKNAARVLRGPSLLAVKDNLHTAWLVEHLTTAPPQSEGNDYDSDRSMVQHRRMPYFNLTTDEAKAIAEALRAASNPSSPPTNWMDELTAMEKKRKSKDPPIRTRPDPAMGQQTFVSLGCIACHQVGELGQLEQVEDSFQLSNLFDGGDLSMIASKRPADAIARWLDDPGRVNKHHRMPKFDLTLHQKLDLHDWLKQQNNQSSSDTHNKLDAVDSETKESARKLDDRATLLKLGKDLIERHQCAACHLLPDSLSSTVSKRMVQSKDAWLRSCVTQSGSAAQSPDTAKPKKKNQPRFVLSKTHEHVLQSHLSQDKGANVRVDQAKQILVEHNCLGCHRRQTEPGIFKHFITLSENFPELASRIPGMTPPALNGVGDKLHRQAIELALGNNPERLRDWLDIRMPQFGLSKSEIASLADYFISHDRIPAGAPSRSPATNRDSVHNQEYWLAAGRLVTPDGFSCQSCHQISDSKPSGIALNAHGTDLTMIGRRVREEWFYRWVKNPARIVPRMEMPAIQIAVQGVLGDSLDQQLHALWLTLNRPDFKPPKPNPIRILRNYNDGQSEYTQVLTDVIEAPAVITRPLVLGFPNRHNWMLDLETGNLRSWWLGDIARQHTRGKSWYWEPGAEPIVKTDWLESLSIRTSDNQALKPLAPENQQFAFELDQLQHTASGVSIVGRLHFGDASRKSLQSLRLQQDWKAVDQLLSNTHFTVTGLQVGQSLVITLPDSSIEESGESNQKLGSYKVKFESGHQFTYSFETEGHRLQKKSIEVLADKNQPIKWLRTMRSSIAPDTIKRLPIQIVPRTAKTVDCVPGFEAVELPVPRNEMPISFAWDSSGRCYMGSLKGRVLEVLDSDSDGLLDDYRLISDELPTPYGIQVRQDGIDVLAKFGLLRLSPSNEGSSIMDFKVVADGWGYTPDYHDWAVGLELDLSGNYYITLPCQQDDRTPEAARWRGHALKLVPTSGGGQEAVKDQPSNNQLSNDQPSNDQPRSDQPKKEQSDRLYRIEPIAGGLRFPMGVALNRQGDLFTSDNQGNYTPFNELNHIRAGKRYGFINKLENKKGFSPPFESPAINIPHPWMRSVNGICFLDTPTARLESEKKPLFGPFEGHLIGCEMNGRCLVRMSLQSVNGQYQGAVYPFSLATGSAKENFEGPIVCKVAPNGDLYIGNLHDSGWGGGNNTGSIVRIRPSGSWPPGIAEVRAIVSGLEVVFTQSVDPEMARNKSNYSIRSYIRTPTPAYGGDDQEEKIESIDSLEYDEQLATVRIGLNALREGAVYELNVKTIGPNASVLFPNQAHYTMRAVPK
ncbi:MAG: c-type cytochrome [Pirellulales bacterium]